jgi:hypothetical protein
VEQVYHGLTSKSLAKQPPPFTITLEVSKSHTTVFVVEYCVEIAHPTIAEAPDKRHRRTSNTAHANVRTGVKWPSNETFGRHAKFLASNNERDGRESPCGARDSKLATTAKLPVELFGLGDLAV